VKRLVSVLGLFAAVAALVLAGIASAGPGKPSVTPLSSKQLRQALTFDGINKHLKKLQRIADANGGNRASGFGGYDASAAYVERTLDKAGWKVKTQSFDFEVFFEDAPTVFEQTAPTPTTYVEDTDFSTMDFSGSGEVTAELVAVDLLLPPPAEPGSSSGCEATDFSGLDVTGKVALMQRGTCDFAVKVENAAAAGAAAAVIFNEGQEGRTDVINGTLGTFAKIPAVDTSFALGSSLANGVTNGPTGTSVHVKTTTHAEPRTSTNVVAELAGIEKKKVVMAGAHLDSVTEGPGIQDNGTGSATLLELARQYSALGIQPENTLRFGWWGAEEEGLIGSTNYVAGLGKKQAKKIALYLNFDMIGSPNFARMIYDGDGSEFDVPGPKGSDAIERNFERYFKSQDLATIETEFDGRSDYLPFTDAGIPAGGLFTGAEAVKTQEQPKLFGGTAGVAFDPCYHQACDTVKNVSKRGLSQMSDAVADAVHLYAFDLGALKGGKRPAARTAAAAGADHLGDSLRR
jgi:Zn-dependent M28 family amino/carboxypeptidase